MTNKYKLVAIYGMDFKIHLFAEDDDGQTVEIKWPENWPTIVTMEWIEGCGFECRFA